MSGAPVSTIPPVLARVPGQDRAVAALASAVGSPVHAYLLVGPPGAGKREAAVAFAAALLCPDGGCARCDTCRRVTGGIHPDVVVVERTGASITVGEAREVVRISSRSAVEGRRKVLILTDLHLVGPAAPALLKTIEEPPAGTVFVLTAETVSSELVTIASRCVRVDLGPVAEPVLVSALVDEGVEPATAAAVAAAAGGRIDRARLLAGDPGFAARRDLWRTVPSRLDGTGATVAVLAAELIEACEASVEPLRRRQAEEQSVLAARVRELGERATVLKDLEERHRRQQRRVRTDELRAGLMTLGEAYRDRLVAARTPGEAQDARAAAAAVDAAGRELIRNPNEALLLQALLVRLGRPE